MAVEKLSSFCFRNVCPNNVMMVIVPHEDDEINLAGASIYAARKEGLRVVCIFVTNGDWDIPASVRIEEAVKSLSCLGVSPEDIVFLGYPDGGTHGERSIFYAREKENKFNVNRKTEIHLCRNCNNYHYHYYKNTTYNQLTWDSVIYDIKEVILQNKPDLIMATDFDSHPDHRAVSMAVETAMGEILNSDEGYRPIVLKGLCYSTSYNSIDDFKEINLLSSLVNRERIYDSSYQVDNPVYLWDKRIRIPVYPAVRDKCLFSNVIFRSLACHLSQKAVHKAGRIINGDQVFWLRRTSNLAYSGEIDASSGNPKYVHDFLILTTEDILSKHPKFDSAIWSPTKQDKEKWIRCTFSRPHDIKAMAFYGNVENKQGRILKGKITFSNGYELCIGPIERFGRETMVTFPEQKNITWIKFKILQFQGECAGLTEWEILDEITPKPLNILQICIDNQFAYSWLLERNKDYYISAYQSNTIGTVQWYINGNLINNGRKGWDINQASLKAKTTIRIMIKERPDIWCEAHIKPITIIDKICMAAQRSSGKFLIWYIHQLERKTHRIIKKMKR